MGYNAKLVLHLNMGSKGSVLTKELTDFPGITVSDTWDKKKRKNTRIISFDQKEFPKIEAAVSAWKEKNAIAPHP